MLAGEDAAKAFRNGDLLAEMRKALAERVLDAEMSHHLDQEPEQESGSHRNGHNRKRVATGSGAMELAVPCDRQGRFEPQLAEKSAWDRIVQFIAFLFELPWYAGMELVE